MAHQKNPHSCEWGFFICSFKKIHREKGDFTSAFLIFRVGQREKKEGIPILAMTANAFATDRKKALEMGMNGHIAKPINGEKIQGALEPI